MRGISIWRCRYCFLAMLLFVSFPENAGAENNSGTNAFQQWLNRQHRHQLTAQAAFNAAIQSEKIKCSDAQSPSQISKCVNRRLVAVREHFATFFKSLRGVLEPAPGEEPGDHRQILDTSQEIWTGYRDMMLKTVNMEWEGGRGRTVALARAETALIRSRIRDLNMAYDAALHR